MDARIGKYTLTRELGKGGFGVVYEAHDPTIPRDVAIKILTRIEPEMSERFRREAAAAGKLSHDNIVAIYDYGTEDGRAYIVMPLLPGEDLQRLIDARHRFSVLDVASLMVQIARGLNYAHKQAIIHRDVKPANIRILPNGTAKIMDFGIARFREGNSTFTQESGKVLGTLRYMAPEHMNGRATEPGVDIFPFGIIAYQLLAGVHPFEAAHPPQVMANIQYRQPDPIRCLNPECPEALERIVFRALEKNPESRYRGFDDVLEDLEPVHEQLRRASAEKIVARVRDEIGGGLADAEKRLRDALELDAANAEARELLDLVRKRSPVAATMQARAAAAAGASANRSMDDPTSTLTREADATVAEQQGERPPTDSRTVAQPRERVEGAFGRRSKRLQLAAAMAVAVALIGTGVLVGLRAKAPAQPSNEAAPQKTNAVAPQPTPPAKEKPAAPPPVAPESKPRAVNLSVSPESLAFTVSKRRPESQAKVLRVGEDSAPFPFTVYEKEDWIRVSVPRDRAPGIVRVRIDARRLAVGAHTGTVQVVSPTGAISVPVVATVLPNR